MSWSRRAAALACLPLLAATSACSAAPVVKANGCTAVTSGTVGGRQVVTYDDVTGDPLMSSAITAAAAAWNSAKIPVVLRPAKAGAAITIAASTSPTATTACPKKGTTRTSVITLSTSAFHGVNGKKQIAHPERQVAIEFGHALGLTDTTSCAALMTRKACGANATGPDPKEVDEITALYS